ncbi:hypothetical protein Q7C36_021255 [Tachysurus vachellii]|uniref:B-cell receptor CD22 n=1 Tax=Tachysurus vachellii TaxID=175792 RepID=A0AA88ISC1_TACVA|nr:hypothetical protein Q7C36_021255 [Tachysurus vachellii]
MHFSLALILVFMAVKIPCTFTPDHYGITERQWYRVQSSEGEPQDLRKDPEYSGHVYVKPGETDCSLTVKVDPNTVGQREVKVTCSSTCRLNTHGFLWYRNGQYHKYTKDSIVLDSISLSDEGSYSCKVYESEHRSPPVYLKVTVDWYSWNKKLSCITTCTLSNKPTYIWYKNGQHVTGQDRKELDVSSWGAGSYSCAVRGHEELRSPAICVYDEKNCWSVTYSTQTICGLIGSSVDIHSYFTFPNKYKAMKMFWFIKEQVNVGPVDMIKDEEYQGRVQYTQSSQNDCSLRITNLRERDAQTYRFRFYNDDHTGKYTGQPGVSLSVTDLKVTVSDWYSNKKLSCITTCTLSNKPTYIWYKNGQRVTDQDTNELYVSSKDAGSYSCAVRGHEELRSPAVYSPKNTTAVVLSSGDTVEGDSVTLSCSSDANPPVLTYSWFKQSSAADTLLITGQNYSIGNISSQHRGLYYCTAHNQLGHHNSTPTHLDVFYSPKNTTAVVLSSGDTVEGDSVTLSCSSDANPPVLTYSWFKQSSAADTVLITAQNYSISNISSQHRGLYYCTAHNQLGHHNSTPTHLDVLYPPRNLSVTVIRSVSGDMGTLLCTSDSNPNSSYTWYRKTKEDSSAVKYVVSGFAIALVILVIAVILWMRFYGTYSNRRRAPAPAPTVRREENNKNDSAPVYGNVSAMTSDPTQTPSPEDQDTVLYSSVFFQPKHTQEVPLYLTVQLPKAFNQEEEVEYATVNLVKSRADR